MRTFLFLLLISFSSGIVAQKQIFVRVYDSAGKKIYKGKVFTVTDSSLLLIGKTAPVNIPVSSIGSISTKHSAGNNFLIASVAGAVIGATIGVVSADPTDEILGFTAGEGAAAGALVGAVVGAAIGGTTAIFKNSKTFLINGDQEKWKVFQSFILENSSVKK